MNYTMAKPCDQCPFLKTLARGFTMQRLREFASGEFPCHKTAETQEDEDGFEEYQPTDESLHCAGALIFNEKRGFAHQMARIAERLGMYDATKLDMTAKVR